MQKFKDILINNVQWLTLAIGAAFLGFMGWTYFSSLPDTRVDQDAVDSAGAVPKLEGAISSATPPKIIVPTYAGELNKALAGPSTRKISGRWTTSLPLVTMALPPGGTPESPGNVMPGNAANAHPGKGMTAAASLAAPTIIGTSFGLSTTTPGTFATSTDNTATPTPAPAGTATVDKNWLTAACSISVEQMAKDFAAVSTPELLPTLFVRIECERVEVMPDGSLGAPVMLKPLVGSQLSQNPMPTVGNVQAEQTYRAWAEANQPEILQSPFFQISGGSSWVLPGQKRMAAAPFDPTKYLTGAIPEWLSPEERKLVNDARAEIRKVEEEKKKAAGKQGGKPSADPSMGAGGGGGMPGHRFITPPDEDFADDADLSWSDISLENADGQNPDLISFVSFTAPGDSDLNPGGSRGPSSPGMNPEGAPVVSAFGKVPTAAFDPAAWKDGPIIAFVHDDTIEPNKTYRYHMRYVIMNPVYGQPNAAANPALAQTFAFRSAWSDWTTAFSVPPRTSFFVNNKILSGSGLASFEVFHFAKGTMKSKTFSTSPGDPIGDESDLATGYTLVDLRRDSHGEGYALVMDAEGKITRHDITDLASDRYRDMHNQAMPPAAAGGALPAGG